MSIASDHPVTDGCDRPVSSRGQKPRVQRAFLAGISAAAIAASAIGGFAASGADAAGMPVPRGLGSVSGAPNLPAGFRDTFTSRYVNAGGLRQHVVIGGDGPPLLLIHGWPETWYAWRLVMPELAQHFRVIAVDQRGIGLTDKPVNGYDVGTLANDMAALMTALGHERFSVYGTDSGMPIAYAVAADYPARVEKLVVSEAFIPGVTPSPTVFQASTVPAATAQLLNARLWHLMFNQLPAEVNERLVRGREEIFFGAEFDASAGTTKLPAATVQYYIEIIKSNRDGLRGSFSFYRWLIESGKQNAVRMNTRLQVPVLALGGAQSSGPFIRLVMLQVADNVQSVSVPGGHWVAEEAPDAVVDALLAFLT